MKPKVFIAKPIPFEVEQYIADHCEYRAWRSEHAIPREELLKELEDVEGLLLSGEKIDGELLGTAPKLRVVCNISVGYNNFDLEAMKARNVLGTNTPSVLDETVADLVFGLILASARRIPELDQFVKAGKWVKIIDESAFGFDVHHSVLGIIGMGRIGEAIAKRAKYGFSMDILYHNRQRSPSVEERFDAQYSSLDDLLTKADFVVLMTPLTPETFHLLGAREFQRMKSTAILINASRGETVDEKALLKALQQGEIRAAGLDVFSPEPPETGNPLLNMPNVVSLPHIGSATAKCRFDMAMLAAKNLVNAVYGEIPPNIVPELKK
ncbi:MAG: 2-hydroxyacid dehydrogenase [Desulfitobacteriaceae bacterium]